VLLAGCARAPVSSSGADVRNRFLDAFGSARTPTRGAGMLSVEVGSRGRSGLNTRWAASGESLAIVAYAGPVRAFDATVLDDSVYLALRPYDLWVEGLLPKEEGLGGGALVFIARPWDFGIPWVRSSVERARVETSEAGYRLDGTLSGEGRDHPFTLELNRSAEPVRLRIQHRDDERTLVTIRYGPVGRYELGRAPRWIEWSRPSAKMRLEIEEQSRAKPMSRWIPPRAGDDWTILTLEDPLARDILERILGSEEFR
jgi:hypothetical protein